MRRDNTPISKAMQRFARGEAYWRVLLTTGAAYNALDEVDDPLRGTRPLDWYRDVVASGDTARIAELWMYTPSGDVALKITEPGSAYVFNLSILGFESGLRAQIVGRVDDKAKGTGVAFIWDVDEQKVYQDSAASVLDFAAWRPGIARIGALNIEAMGVRL